ncbi:hypothetical protein AKJ16_DCAP16946 [Drosera capensis]
MPWNDVVSFSQCYDDLPVRYWRPLDNQANQSTADVYGKHVYSSQVQECVFATDISKPMCTSKYLPKTQQSGVSIIFIICMMNQLKKKGTDKRDTGRGEWES